ncbi:alanine--tRNA ligase [Micavibrio aeruginosavorus]|uniref:Alanine--tRNA ligase n=1 Tax=Micavibrio aeruginosavorus (strain ARL-13) TaxID=856793 RepID=G2KNP1_MICAA|nr:alanine--tRNA ligase [Micavibrio aeruginosavorus]AEP10286.1 alanyl-tRNA synthetase [Micavibrio aeruginosavorus ARL-13]
MTKTVQDIRSTFLDFFADKGHQVVQSSSLVPDNDPTLMFANSGMVQFKNVFTGVETRPYNRATTAQKCVRAGGKHNDLDNVGYTARHHTFFEMMGNFSFGDYFKEDAIAFAWEVVTKRLDMPKDKLLVTVHSSDEEAAAIWRKVAGFSDSKILRINTNDNFWMMGDTGPCGPCSEIFYDQGDKLAGGPPGSADQDGDRFLEFWNLVFMQYEQEPDGNGGHIRKPLPKPSIDTGMGLERTTALVQGKFTNYDIDLLRAIIEHSADLTGVSPDGAMAPSHRVIADHLRASAFLIADGVMPSNEGRGYVLRRIMRRGMRHAHLLGARDPLMFRLLPTLVAKMGEAYPELKRAEALISETLKLEETRFKRTLDNGLKLLDEETADLQSGQALGGNVAFKLYDTFGFPLDLTQDALRARGIDVDLDGFNTAMEKQRAQARKNWAGSGDAKMDAVWFDLLDKVGPTEFLGYETEHAEAQVRTIVKDGAVVDAANVGDTVHILVNQTPFYAESGGQVGDTGVIRTAGGAEITVNDTRKMLGKLFVHVGTVKAGTLKNDDAVELVVDHDRRSAIRANHSATHLLHEALRRVLGNHVAQKGSLQTADRTRFDISHNAAITPEQIAEVERMVNEEIRANTPVVTRVMPIDDAMESGAMALFGEKYDDEVRVVSMGTVADGANKSYSVELCGGTHVKRTGDIGLLKIVSESAVSAGVRRVEAVTGAGALAYLNNQEKMLQAVADVLKAGPADVFERVRTLMDDRRRMENEMSNLRRQMATGGGAGASSGPDVKDIGGVKFTSRVLEGFPAKDLKPMVDDLKKKIGSGVITLIATDDGKASIVVGVTDDLTARVSAVDLVKTGVEVLGGKGGGGRPDMAQGGGPNADAANDAVNAIEQQLAS